MKKKILILFILFLIIISIIFMYKRAEILIQAKEIQINNVDLTKLEDGLYKGEYSLNGIVEAVVLVSVKNHSIVDIKLIKHNHGKGKKAEKLPSQVIKTQRLDLDVVSGATVSSKVILKAIENALTTK